MCILPIQSNLVRTGYKVVETCVIHGQLQSLIVVVHELITMLDNSCKKLGSFTSINS
jgi:hypothetical protein